MLKGGIVTYIHGGGCILGDLWYSGSCRAGLYVDRLTAFLWLSDVWNAFLISKLGAKWLIESVEPVRDSLGRGFCGG